MTLNQDELREVFEAYIRFQIDVNQGLNYCLDYKDKKGIDNMHAALDAFDDFLTKIKS